MAHDTSTDEKIACRFSNRELATVALATFVAVPAMLDARDVAGTGTLIAGLLAILPSLATVFAGLTLVAGSGWKKGVPLFLGTGLTATGMIIVSLSTSWPWATLYTCIPIVFAVLAARMDLEHGNAFREAFPASMVLGAALVARAEINGTVSIGITCVAAAAALAVFLRERLNADGDIPGKKNAVTRITAAGIPVLVAVPAFSGASVPFLYIPAIVAACLLIFPAFTVIFQGILADAAAKRQATSWFAGSIVLLVIAVFLA